MSKVIPFISYYPFMICNFMPKVSPLPCGDKCPKKSWKHMKNIERQLKPSSRIPMTPHFFVLWSPGPFALILGPLLFCSGCCTTSHHLTKFISRATQVAPHNIGALARWHLAHRDASRTLVCSILSILSISPTDHFQGTCGIRSLDMFSSEVQYSKLNLRTVICAVAVVESWVKMLAILQCDRSWEAKPRWSNVHVILVMSVSSDWLVSRSKDFV